jgi:hypothetical protein
MAQDDGSQATDVVKVAIAIDIPAIGTLGPRQEVGRDILHEVNRTLAKVCAVGDVAGGALAPRSGLDKGAIKNHVVCFCILDYA